MHIYEIIYIFLNLVWLLERTSKNSRDLKLLNPYTCLSSYLTCDQ